MHSQVSLLHAKLGNIGTLKFCTKQAKESISFLFFTLFQKLWISVRVCATAIKFLVSVRRDEDKVKQSIEESAHYSWIATMTSAVA